MKTDITINALQMMSLSINLHTKTGRGTKSAGGAEPRIYIHPKGENVMQNLLARFNRPVDFYKTAIIPMVLEAVGLPANTEMGWSQYAGCTCACSPGFIVKDRSFQYDIFVDVGIEQEIPNKLPVAVTVGGNDGQTEGINQSGQSQDAVGIC